MAVVPTGHEDERVSFMQYDLGYFDHETCRLEPTEIPFAAKVLPMSPVRTLRLPGWPIRLLDPNRLVYLEIDAVAVAVGVRQLRLARFGAHCRYVSS